MATKTTTKKIKKESYIQGLGRRKTSIASVRLYPAKKSEIIVNNKPFSEYFPTFELQGIIQSALKKAKVKSHFKAEVKVRGGGIHSQAEAIRHGFARALITFDEKLKPQLKKEGYVTRDPRMKERRKFGLKKARRAPQWSKR